MNAIQEKLYSKDGAVIVNTQQLFDPFEVTCTHNLIIPKSETPQAKHHSFPSLKPASKSKRPFIDN